MCFDPRRSSLREVKCLFGVCEKFSEIVTIFCRSSSIVDVTVVIVNKVTLRQTWSLVTSIGKGDKSCDFIE